MKIGWQWGCNRYLGIMFGPLPIGWMVLGVGVALYYGLGD